MPSKDAHIAAARENQKTIDYLVQRIDEHSGWVVTVAFYKALHLVEAAFAADPAGLQHFDDHYSRNRYLKRNQKYAHVWKHYQPLWAASLIARYLRQNDNAPTYDIFTSYMSPDVVKSKVLGHYLRQIEKSIGKLLGDANFSAL